MARKKLRRTAKKTRKNKAAAPDQRAVAPRRPDARQRTVALLSLEKLSRSLQSDVIADPAFGQAFGISVTNTVNLGDRPVARDRLFSAFREALRHNAVVSLKDADGAPVGADVTVTEQGAGCVTLGAKRFVFPNAAVFDPHTERRAEAVDHALRENSLLSSRAAEFGHLTNDVVSHENAFAAMSMLGSSPEAFFKTFKWKLEQAGDSQIISRSDLLPEDARYWDNLAPPPQETPTVVAYVADVLSPEATCRIKRNDSHARAFTMMTPLFVSPAFVPHAAFSSESADRLVEMIEPRLGDDGHFALLGIVEICAMRAADDRRFVGLGARALRRLFLDMPRLERSCGLFAPTFVIVTAFLATHENFASRPVYWRRLAAAAHAGLIVRACGVADSTYDDLLRWAFSVSGDEYMMSVLADMAEEPGWRPDWIVSKFMVADAVGRARNVITRMPDEAVPPEWREIVAGAEEWIDERHLTPCSLFPSIGEGARKPAPSPEDLVPSGQAVFAAFQDDPSIGRLKQLAGFAYACGFPMETRGVIPAVLENVRRASENFEDRDIQIACIVSAHVSAQAQDSALGRLTGDVVLEKLRGVTGSAAMFEAICTLVTCSCAQSDRVVGRKDLVERLENVAFTARSSVALNELISSIDALRAVQPALSGMLGRAAAAARLGLP